MTITFISTLDAYWGGSEVLWVETAKQMIREGHHVQVAVYKRKKYHPSLLELLKSAHSTHYITSMRNVGQSNYLTKVFHLIYRKLRPQYNIKGILNFNSNILFVNQPATYEGIYYPDINLLVRQHRGKLMLLTHGNFEHIVLPPDKLKEAKRIFSNACCLFFVSKKSHKATEHELALKLPNSIIVDNPLNIKDQTLIEYPSLTTTIQFASVARLDAMCKGQDLLIKVLSSEKWKKRDWHFNLYGEGDDLHYLITLADFYQLNDKVTFHGYVNDIREIWKKNHILIMPSFAEGKPIALAEAMICGRPAIVTNVAGNSELIINNRTGFLIEAPTYCLINEVLEHAWNNRDNWKSLGIEARNYALTNYDLHPIDTLVKKIKENA